MSDFCPFWTLLRDRERAALEAAGRMRSYQQGEIIIQAVSPDKHVVVILDGSVRVMASARNGRPTILAIRGPGEVVGELTVLDSGPRYATVEAAAPVRGLVLRHPGLTEVLDGHPRIMQLLTSVAMGRLREADRRRAEYSTASVLSRTAAVILDLVEEREFAGCQPIHLDITSQADLAGLVATSRESVTRALAELRSRGAITTSRRYITIVDIRRLHEVAES